MAFETQSLVQRIANKPSFRTDALICALILISYILIWPVGDYPILDDWSFVKSLSLLHYDGVLRISEWNPMSAIAHFFWGILFTKVFGFSFTVTKLSVFVMFVLNYLVFSRVLRRLGANEKLILASGIAFVFQPLHFPHAMMYMTDVPAMLWQNLSILCFILAFDYEDRRRETFLFAGALACGATFLCRQSGVLVPTALFTTLVLSGPRYWKVRNFLTPFLPFAFFVLGFSYWYNNIHGPTATYKSSLAQTKEILLSPPWEDLPRLFFALVMYLGMFITPVAASISLTTYRLSTKAKLIVFLSVLWLIVNLFLASALQGRLFPYFRNVLTPFGYFSPQEFIQGDWSVVWGPGVAWLISLGMIAGILALFQAVIADGWELIWDSRFAFAARFLIILLGGQVFYLFLTSPIVFDRHLLLFLPTGLFLFCLFKRNAQVDWPTFVAIMSPLVFLSVAGMHDIHQVSRLNFIAGNQLIKEGVNPHKIEGGYAFNGWYLFEKMATEEETEKSKDVWYIRYLGLEVDPQYVIALMDDPEISAISANYKVLRNYPYSNWLRGGTRYVSVWKRNATPESEQTTAATVSALK